ncbi:MAG TPA: complex I NDUFA9 subunit family protein [Burkholderiales bacterium]|nr:complex I NDUFA9 subunit family protein [Burkholderiales bacterium]
MTPNEVLVVGGSGFIGRHLVASLAAAGLDVTVPSRRRERAKHLILLPTVDVLQADIMAPGALERLCSGKQAVYNLVGVLHSRRGRRDQRGPNDYGPDFARFHVELPQAIVAACRNTGVRRLIHISALGASPTGPSEYLRSKGIGEKAVLAAEDLDVTVFRPSVVFGPEDTFLNQFAAMARFLPVMAVPCPEARFQPAYVGDVARALHFALDEPNARGKTFELCGPRVYTLQELVQWVCAVTGRRRLVVGLTNRLSYMQAWMLEHLPGKFMTRDNYRSMQVPNTSDAPFPFRLQPQALEAVAPGYLAPDRAAIRPRARYPQLRWRARR